MTGKSETPDPPQTGLGGGTDPGRPAGHVEPPSPTTLAGSFTTELAATSVGRIVVTIPAPFLSSGTGGTLLRLVPVEHLRGEPMELYLKSGSEFTLGRSPDADWVACFFPRNEKNDQRSRRVSKIHARIALREGQLWLQRPGGAMLHIGTREVSPNPDGLLLRERDQIIFAEDYGLEVHYDISLQGTLLIANGEAWQAGRIAFPQGLLGAVRFEPVNSALGFRNSCWLFVDVAFGSARGGVLTAGSGLAPQQGVILMIGGCFWILNLVNNDKVAINDHRVAGHEIIPLTQGDSIWLGAVRHRVEIA